MKIAILHPFQFRYARGIERFTWSLGEVLTKQDVQVDLMTWRWPNPVDWGPIPEGMTIKQVPACRYYSELFAIPHYVYWLQQEKYDWVMLYFAGYGEAQAINVARLLSKQRYCVVFHFPMQEAPHRYKEFERFGLAQRADRRIAVSSYVAQGVTERFERPCAVIGNGVDTNLFCPDDSHDSRLRKRLGIAPDAPVLLTLAALEERKGIHRVIRALPLLLEEFPNLSYWVLGEGKYRTELEAEIRALHLEKNVLLLGASNRVVPYLAEADIGCLLAHGEAFGIALIEYMAMGLPVVASLHPPFPELVRPDWGELADETDAAAVAAALRKLLRDPERRRRMGAAGRQRTLESHTWNHMAEEYLKVLA